jgi:hypothetical protein
MWWSQPDKDEQKRIAAMPPWQRAVVVLVSLALAAVALVLVFAYVV